MAEKDINSKITIPPTLSLSAVNYGNHLAAGKNHVALRFFDGHVEIVGEISQTISGSFSQVASGNGFSLMLEGGSITSYGSISGVPSGSNFVQIEAGEDYGLGLTNDGHVVGFGSNSIINNLPDYGGIQQVAAGSNFVVLLMWDGSLKGVGITVPSINDGNKISAGKNHGAVLKTNGDIQSFGDDSYNQVSGTPGDYFIDLSCGFDFTVGLKGDNSLKGWGRDNYNQILEIPDYPSYTFSEVSCGFGFGVTMTSKGAIKIDGLDFTWGKDDYNQTSDAPHFIGENTFDYIPNVFVSDYNYSPNELRTSAPMDLDLFFSLKETNDEPVRVSYDLKINDSIYLDGSFLSQVPYDVNVTIPFEEFNLGGNTVEIIIDSDQELKETTAGIFSVNVIDDIIQEIEFEDDLIPWETLIRKIHTTELEPHIINEEERRVWGSGCSSSCSGACQGCSNTCTSECSTSCSGGCKTSCSGACRGGCGGGCDGCSDRYW
jgi:hypothetical protein